MLPRIRLAGMVLAGLMLLAGAALASPQTSSLLQSLEASARDNGDRLVGDAKSGELDDAKEITLTFDVDPDKSYRLYGVCDSDCTELSVSADDAEGHLIDNSSGQDDDMPVIEIEDFKGRTISVEVFMMDCKADPCGFAISLAEDPNAAAKIARSIALSAGLIGGSSSDRSTPSTTSDDQLVSDLKKRVLDIFALVGDIGVGQLGSGEARRFFFDADPDTIYEGFAVCDCSDLNLVAYDDDDKTLASDLDRDNRPAIELVSDKWPEGRRSGRQRLVLEVKMKDCGRSSCGFAFGLYKPKS